jgi:hypothetical protein
MNDKEKMKLARDVGLIFPHYTNTDNPIDFPPRVTMNKKIEQLATQAGMVMYPTGLGIQENTLWGDRNIGKFAELIIAECIDSIKSWRDAQDEQMDKEEHWKGYRSGCNDGIVEIQQRFGDTE